MLLTEQPQSDTVCDTLAQCVHSSAVVMNYECCDGIVIVQFFFIHTYVMVAAAAFIFINEFSHMD